MSVFLVLACHIDSWKMGLETLLQDHYTIPKFNIGSLFFLFFFVGLNDNFDSGAMGEHSGHSTDDDVEVDERQESDSDLGIWFT